MKLKTIPVLLLVLIRAGVAPGDVTVQGLPFTATFESYPPGASLQGYSNDGWSASSPGVVIETNVVWTNNIAPNVKAVEVPPEMLVTHAVTHPAPATNVWTDCELMMVQDKLETPPDVNSNAVIQLYVDRNGVLRVYDMTAGGWAQLTNNVLGSNVTALATGQWARVSINQNYQTHQCAIFLDGVALRDRLPFVSNVTQCSQFRLDGAAGESLYFDNYAMTLAAPAALTADLNHDNTADAQEIEAHGYVARTLMVGAGQAFTTIQAAVNAALGRDVINIAAGTYAEDVVISHAVGGLTGAVFTVNGTLTVGAGVMVTSQVGFASTHLVVNDGGQLAVANGTLTADGLVLSGTFTVGDTWGIQGLSTIPFSDTFETYAEGTPVSLLGYRGWSASEGAILVESNVTFGGSARAVALVNGQAVSNQVSITTTANMWTDFQGIWRYDGSDEMPAVNPDAMAQVFVNSNGFLVVRNGAVWDVCSNSASGGAVAPIGKGQWIHVIVNSHFDSKTIAVFLDGVLLRQDVPFINAGVTRYSSFGFANDQPNAAYLDNLQITADMPSSLASDPDAQCIQIHGRVLIGVVFLFR